MSTINSTDPLIDDELDEFTSLPSVEQYELIKSSMMSDNEEDQHNALLRIIDLSPLTQFGSENEAVTFDSTKEQLRSLLVNDELIIPFLIQIINNLTINTQNNSLTQMSTQMEMRYDAVQALSTLMMQEWHRQIIFEKQLLSISSSIVTDDNMVDQLLSNLCEMIKCSILVAQMNAAFALTFLVMNGSIAAHLCSNCDFRQALFDIFVLHRSQCESSRRLNENQESFRVYSFIILYRMSFHSSLIDQMFFTPFQLDSSHLRIPSVPSQSLTTFQFLFYLLLSIPSYTCRLMILGSIQQILQLASDTRFQCIKETPQFPSQIETIVVFQRECQMRLQTRATGNRQSKSSQSTSIQLPAGATDKNVELLKLSDAILQLLNGSNV